MTLAQSLLFVAAEATRYPEFSKLKTPKSHQKKANGVSFFRRPDSRRDREPTMQFAVVPAAETKRLAAAVWIATVDSDKIRLRVSKDAVPWPNTSWTRSVSTMVTAPTEAVVMHVRRVAAEPALATARDVDIRRKNSTNRSTEPIHTASHRHNDEKAFSAEAPPKRFRASSPPEEGRRREVYGQAVARLQQGSGAAAATLLRVMADAATPAASRVRAAQCVLDNASRAIELQDLAVRLRALENGNGREDAVSDDLEKAA